MKNKLVTLLLLFMIVIGNSQAQSYRKSILDKNSNYFDIVKTERERLKPLYNLSDRNSKKQIKQFERWASFWKDRIRTDGSFTSATFKYNEWKKDKQSQSELKTRSVNAVGDWSLIGPTTPPQSNIGFYPGMGRVNTIAFNGTDTNTMYIGSPAGGVWKTTDAGNSWTAKGDDLPNMGISHIVIDPNNPNTVYIATGDADGYQNTSLGVFKSTNGGDTWNTTGLNFTIFTSTIISKLLIDPNNTTTIFATTRNHIKKSINGGNTWVNVLVENNAIFNDIAYKKGSNSIIYASSRSGKFYISTNNGDNWSVAANVTSGRLDFALTGNDSNQIISIDDTGVIRKSIDQGTTWTVLSTINNYSSQGNYDMAIAVSPLDKNLILAGGIEGWRSADGGVTWEKYLDGYWNFGQPYFYVHSDHHDMLFVPNSNIAFSVNDGGVFKGDASIDIAWEDLSSGLAITQYYNVSGTPQNANFLIGGAQDNDIARYDGVDFIGENPGSDGVEGLWDYSDSNIAWTCSQSGGLLRTTDGFTTSQYINTPIGAPFIWELEIHPTVPTTIFGGFDDIHKSIDRGNNWTDLNSGVGSIEFISIAPSNGNTIYVSGKNGQVKKTTDGGTVWSSINLPQNGYVKSIEVHPTNPNEVYIAYSGYAAGKVYKSIDAGANWQNITGSLPNIPTHKILYKTGSTNGELFLATDLGVYYRTNTAGDWIKLDAGLPNVIVHDIEIHYGTNKLRAATYGRGIWERSIAPNALGIANSVLPQNAVTLYPNPSIDKTFSIKLSNLDGNSQILIYNIVGSVVKELDTINDEETINLDKYSTGIYLIKVVNNGKSITKKIILK